MKKRFYKDSYQKGYNTRDDAENIPFESCQSLVNARPGIPNPTPREGITAWSEVDSLTQGVRFTYPFKTTDEKYLIFVSGTGLYYATDDTDKTLILTDAGFPSVGHFTAVRIKDSLYLLTDTFGTTSWIITWGHGVFTGRKTNIDRPPMALTATSHTGTGTSIPPGKFVSFALTLVARDDDDAFSGTDAKLCDLDTVGFSAGLLETIDNIDERVTYENTTGVIKDVDLSILINNVVALDAQATHLRLYVTDPQTTAAAAEGAEHKWFADLPLFGSFANGVPLVPGPVDPYTYTLDFDEGQLAGALDTLKVVGYDAMPLCRYGIYIQGRLWLGAADTSGDAIGRWYYSEIPLDLDSPQKWASMFILATFFKDTSIDNTDVGKGLGLSRNDLVFVMTKSVWSLRDGDPDFEPQIIDTDNGTPFPNTLTQIGNDLGYVGNFGPVLIQGREANPLDEFSAGEVWPIARGRPGYFFALEDKDTVKGFFYRETFFVCDESKIVGMYMPNSGNGRGPWEVQPATPDVKLGHINIFDRDTCVVVASVAELAPAFYQFLAEGTYQDLFQNFFVKSKSMQYLFDARNRDQAGELYDILVNASFSDASRFDIFVTSNYFRFRWDGTYHETPSTDDLTDDSIDTTWRKVLQQGFPEGLVGFTFEVEWVKEFAAPFDFECSGFTLRAKPVSGHPVEYVSQDLGSGPLENGPDIDFWYGFDFNVLTEPDLGPQARSLAYANGGNSANRAYLASLVPSGGVILSGAVNASGYRAGTYTGLPVMTRGLSREYVVRAAALVRTVWLELGGDGTSFFGVKITPTGALVVAIYNATVKATYSSPAAVLPVSPGATDDYTIQISLSSDMLTCRMYVALRTAAFTQILPVTAAVLAAGGPGTYLPGGLLSYFQDLFAALAGGKWSGGAVAGGYLTQSANYIGSVLAIALHDILTLSANLRLATNGSYTGASIARCGYILTFSDASTLTVYLGAFSAGAGGPISLIMLGTGGGTYVLDSTMGASQNFDARLTVEVSRTSVSVYLDGLLRFSREFAAPITTVSALEVTATSHANLDAKVADVLFAGILGLGTAGGTLDLVEIPVRHLILPGATYGISHARGLRIQKPALRAQAFHNALKGKVL